MIFAIKTFSVLSKSTIEGIDTLATKFQNIYLTMKKKQYDFLAPRKAEFEVDFAEFMTQMGHLEVHNDSLVTLGLLDFENKCFSQSLISFSSLSRTSFRLS